MIKKITFILSLCFVTTVAIATEIETQVPAVKSVAPAYPSSAMQRQHTGWALLEYVVNEKGNAEQIRVVDSEPARVFDREAIKALRQSKFEVTTVDGSAVEVGNQVRRYVFELDEQIPGNLASK